MVAEFVSAHSGNAEPAANFSTRTRLRHDVETYVVGPSNQLAYNAALYVAEFPGAQYNPLFVHGNCGLGKRSSSACHREPRVLMSRSPRVRSSR